MEALGFHWPSLIAYLLNFTILLIVLTKFAYKPILKILDERSSNIKDTGKKKSIVNKKKFHSIIFFS